YKLRDKHRFHERAFTKPDRADQFLASLKTSTTELRKLLRSQKTEFVVVTAAERLVIEETKDLVNQLRSFGICVRHLVINKLFPDLNTDFSRIRRDQEQKLVEEIRTSFYELQIMEVYLQPSEPRGTDNLRQFASLLYS
ncbi:MAG: ArsA-related P-loop ATPase, partial [Dehalococcoidia bacterium]|nr:ArsA-related P-loop ATPase [Dehalococcoidia bacterium]